MDGLALSLINIKADSDEDYLEGLDDEVVDDSDEELDASADDYEDIEEDDEDMEASSDSEDEDEYTYLEDEE